jgi:hypothetical protein
VIWGAYKRTFVCDTISFAVGAITIVSLSALGFDLAAIPTGVILGFSAFVSLAVYRQRYGRL